MGPVEGVVFHIDGLWLAAFKPLRVGELKMQGGLTERLITSTTSSAGYTTRYKKTTSPSQTLELVSIITPDRLGHWDEA